VTDPAKPTNYLSKDFQKRSSILVVKEDFLPCIPAGRDVVDGSLKLDS
jgi:hypothetical protein